MSKSFKQAYLVLCHKDPAQVINLCKILDHSQNDIFLHIDKKAKFSQSSVENLMTACKFSKVRMVKPVRVQWGGYSGIKAELSLLKEAVKYDYDYYHLISGQDLPIKSQSEIIRYFEGTQEIFLGFDEMCDESLVEDRIRYHYYFQEFIGRYADSNHTVLKAIQRYIISFEKGLHYKRKINVKLKKGPNWFSIPSDFAKYVLSREKWIKKYFQYTNCADEIFMQTILYDSPFFSRRHHLDGEDKDDNLEALRYIDWKRGRPYIFRNEDYDTLLNKEGVFWARKFDINIDYEIIKRVISSVEEKQLAEI